MRCSGLPALGPQASKSNPSQLISEACLKSSPTGGEEACVGQVADIMWFVRPAGSFEENPCPVRPKTEVESKGRFHLYMNIEWNILKPP